MKRMKSGAGRICRRDFVVRAGVTLAAISAPWSGFPAIVKRRRPNEMLSHASVGCGNRAESDLKDLASHPELNVTAICDVDLRFLDKARKIYPDARIYRDAFEMMAAEGDRIDSVNVSTPDHTHAQYIIEALKRNLNVYGQKPLCHNLVECRRVERLAAQKKAVTQMGTQAAAWECDRRTVAALRRGVIGEVQHVWLFSTRRPAPGPERFAWPVSEAPVPKTLEWKLWLGPAKWRPYANKQYHPKAWRKWRTFGTSWLGDLGLHLMCPVWLGMGLGQATPESAIAEIAADNWTTAQREQFWPSTSHVIWTFPGVKASGMKPFAVEWCDGFETSAFKMEPKFLPPAFLQDIAAQTPLGSLPTQGRVIEGSKGWILSTHCIRTPYYVMKDGATPPLAPMVEPVPSHHHEYVNACLGNGKVNVGFDIAGRMTEWSFMGNLAQLQPGERLDCAKLADQAAADALREDGGTQRTKA